MQMRLLVTMQQQQMQRGQLATLQMRTQLLLVMQLQDQAAAAVPPQLGALLCTNMLFAPAALA
jgi:hypothetical protein